MSVFCPHKLAQLGTHAKVWYPNTSVQALVPLPLGEYTSQSLGRGGECGITQQAEDVALAGVLPRVTGSTLTEVEGL